MPALASLLSSRDAERLAAVRARAEQVQRTAAAAAAVTPVQPVCPACGQLRPVPAAVFREAAP
jgi:hypothetical protein